MKIYDPKRINYDLFLLTVFVVASGSLMGVYGYLNRPEKIIEIDLKEEVKGTLTGQNNYFLRPPKTTTTLPSLAGKRIRAW